MRPTQGCGVGGGLLPYSGWCFKRGCHPQTPSQTCQLMLTKWPVVLSHLQQHFSLGGGPGREPHPPHGDGRDSTFSWSPPST